MDSQKSRKKDFTLLLSQVGGGVDELENHKKKSFKSVSRITQKAYGLFFSPSEIKPLPLALNLFSRTILSLVPVFYNNDMLWA
jgi:hypothetical protein